MKKGWLYNKVIIISGASGGIGFSLAERLIKNYGCTVLAIGRNQEKMQQNQKLLGEFSDKFIPYYFDVSKKENWETFAKTLANENVIPDILINNAGFMLPFSKFELYSDEEIEEIIRTDFVSNVYSIKKILPILKKSKTPAIINVSSAAGLLAVVGESMYSATKFAVRGFTEALRQEYKKEIYVAGIYPGFIKTNILNRMSVSDKNNKLINKLMMPVSKATKKMVNGIRRKKSRIVLGIDGKSMSFISRLMPSASSTIVAKVLKASKLEMFNKVFNYKGEMK